MLCLAVRAAKLVWCCSLSGHHLTCCNQQLLLCAGSALDPCKAKACDPGKHCEREACGDADFCDVLCIPDETVHITGREDNPSDTPEVPSSSSGILTVTSSGVVSSPTAEPSMSGIVTVFSSPAQPNSGVPLGQVASASLPASNAAGNSNSAVGSNTCPDGSPPVNCLVDPCAASPCLKGTLCVSNYCGGKQSVM
jgi:hypothetical protein